MITFMVTLMITYKKKWSFKINIYIYISKYLSIYLSRGYLQFWIHALEKLRPSLVFQLILITALKKALMNWIPNKNDFITIQSFLRVRNIYIYYNQFLHLNQMNFLIEYSRKLRQKTYALNRKKSLLSLVFYF